MDEIELLQRIVAELATIRRGLGMPDPQLPAPKPATRRAFVSGMTIIGDTVETDRPHVLRCRPGTLIEVTGGAMKRGEAADGKNPWGADMPYHDVIDPITSCILQAGESATAACPAVDPSGQQRLQEAVVIRADEQIVPTITHAWPSVVAGATRQDVEEFLRITDWVPETRLGWASRHGRAVINFGPSSEAGYGGVIAERTSFGALLLASDLSVAEKNLIAVRLWDMYVDIVRSGATFPADGGHGNGRYILWLLARAIAPTSITIPESSFSEVDQVVSTPGLAGALDDISFRMNRLGSPDNSSPYATCCTANRWAGAAILAMLDPGLQASPLWIRYSRAYLRRQLSVLPAWFALKHDRSLELVQSNKKALGL